MYSTQDIIESLKDHLFAHRFSEKNQENKIPPNSSHLWEKDGDILTNGQSSGSNFGGEQLWDTYIGTDNVSSPAFDPNQINGSQRYSSLPSDDHSLEKELAMYDCQSRKRSKSKKTSSATADRPPSRASLAEMQIQSILGKARSSSLSRSNSNVSTLSLKDRLRKNKESMQELLSSERSPLSKKTLKKPVTANHAAVPKAREEAYTTKSPQLQALIQKHLAAERSRSGQKSSAAKRLPSPDSGPDSAVDVDTLDTSSLHSNGGCVEGSDLPLERMHLAHRRLQFSSSDNSNSDIINWESQKTRNNQPHRKHNHDSDADSGIVPVFREQTSSSSSDQQQQPIKPMSNIKARIQARQNRKSRKADLSRGAVPGPLKADHSIQPKLKLHQHTSVLETSNLQNPHFDLSPEAQNDGSPNSSGDSNSRLRLPSRPCSRASSGHRSRSSSPGLRVHFKEEPSESLSPGPSSKRPQSSSGLGSTSRPSSNRSTPVKSILANYRQRYSDQRDQNQRDSNPQEDFHTSISYDANHQNIQDSSSDRHISNGYHIDSKSDHTNRILNKYDTDFESQQYEDNLVHRDLPPGYIQRTNAMDIEDRLSEGHIDSVNQSIHERNSFNNRDLYFNDSGHHEYDHPSNEYHRRIKASEHSREKNSYLDMIDDSDVDDSMPLDLLPVTRRSPHSRSDTSSRTITPVQHLDNDTPIYGHKNDRSQMLKTPDTKLKGCIDTERQHFKDNVDYHDSGEVLNQKSMNTGIPRRIRPSSAGPSINGLASRIKSDDSQSQQKNERKSRSRIPRPHSAMSQPSSRTLSAQAPTSEVLSTKPPCQPPCSSVSSTKPPRRPQSVQPPSSGISSTKPPSRPQSVQPQEHTRPPSPGVISMMSVQSMASDMSGGLDRSLDWLYRPNTPSGSDPQLFRYKSNLEMSKDLRGSKSSLVERLGSLRKSAKSKIAKLQRAVSLDRLDKSGSVGNPDSSACSIEEQPPKLKKSSSLQSLRHSFSKKKDRSKKYVDDGVLHDAQAAKSPRRRSLSPSLKRSSSSLSINSVDSPTHGRVIGKLLALNTDGSQVIELKKPPHGPFGFYIAKGSAKYNNGVFISRMSDGHPEKLFAGLLGIGDEILEINNRTLQGGDLDIAYDIMAQHDTLTMKVLPFMARTDQ
ncbi:unnamed protein product [Owenia fusiformis]|uniref:Uncharacterized protein n=1 Tax=Owenia fusiformis TaxID=6347 RepID=A0A8J1XVC1_OWEFU|nr:unnamed protein product [Owenia fusiformis]